MGRLSRIELFNFKSYKGHQIIDFGDSYFTSIIGPNGSGKSNRGDHSTVWTPSLSFLGIKSSHLRSAHMRDLVYRGRVLKHSKETGMDVEAEIEAENSTSREDPKTAWVMAVYLDDEENEQMWKRSITAQGSSEYRINNKVVTAQDYNAAMEKENILIKARNFLVFQGDVEAVASQSPRDLTRLIEQISGSLEYKAEYEQLKVEQEKAAEQLNSIIMRRRALNGEHKQYVEQKKEVESFEKKSTERDQAIINHILWKLYHFQQTMEDNKVKIETKHAEIRECKRLYEREDAKLDDLKRVQAKGIKAVSVQEKVIKEKEKSLSEKETSLLPIDEKVTHASHTVLNLENRIKIISREEKEHSESLDDLKKQLKTVEKAEGKFEAEQAKLASQKGTALSASDQTEYLKLREQANTRTANEGMKADSLARQLRTDSETTEALRSNYELVERSLAKHQNDLTTATEFHKDHEEQSKKLSGDLNIKKSELKQLVASRLDNQNKRGQKDEKLREATKKLMEMEDSQRHGQKEMRFREILSNMKRIFPGVRGRISELCKPKQKKFKDAISTVLGRNFDAIVVDNEKTAKDCIQYLKEQRAGQSTFIPLDSIKNKPIDPKLKGMHRNMRLAIDAIDYDNSIEAAMQYSCGNAVICDDLQVARQMAYDRNVNVKVVTVDGTVIHKGGQMTGGRVDQRNARRWEDGEVEALKKIVNSLREELGKLGVLDTRADEEQLQREIQGGESRLSHIKEERDRYKSTIDSKKKEVADLKKKVAELKPKLAAAEKALTQLTNSYNTAKAQVSQAEDDIFGSFCNRLGFSDIREYEERHGSMQAETTQKKFEFSKQKNRLETQLNFAKETLKSTTSRLADLKKRLEQNNRQIDGFNEEKKTITELRDELIGELDELKEELEQKQESLAETSEKVNTQRKEVSRRNKDIESVAKSITQLEGEVERVSTEKYALLRRCKLEEIGIPLAADSAPLDDLPIEDAIAQAEDPDAMDVDEDPNTASKGPAVIQDFGIKPDFDDLDEDLREDGGDKTDEELAGKIRTLESELEKMAPNMKAIDRLEGVENRLQEVDKEYEKAKRHARTAKEDFLDVKETRFQKFNDAFKHISEQIGKVYKDLTKSATFPLGGSAHLDMEDGDEPYLDGIRYTAMPPMKRFRDMEHLSGGEKTMAALALLFAIHSYQASPFFVLDEVDAALDNANVQKIARYISEKASPGFQFVVISLKTVLFQQSESLVGIYRDQVENSSKCLKLDLRGYVPG